MRQIKDRIKEIIVEVLGNKIFIEQINKDDDLMRFGFNSISYIKMIVKIEAEFEIEFEDEDLDLNRFKTVQSFIDYVQDKMS